jgi:hypothetical protein
MANPNFPGPKYNKVIESDKQIVQVPLDNAGIGGRKVSTSQSVKNDTTTIRHTKSEG